MPIADFNTLVDDDSSNKVGTPMDKAQLQALLMGAYVSRTDTGAVNNWAPGIAGHSFFEWNGAADATISGIVGGRAGLTVVVRNVSATKVLTFPHQSGLSSAGNKLTNVATSAGTPVASGGFIAYRHDGTDWQQVGHQQGVPITPAYAAGNFTGSGSMTWTVDSGDVATYAYLLEGQKLTVWFFISTTTVGGTPSAGLQMALPGGFTAFASHSAADACYVSDNGGSFLPGLVQCAGGATLISIFRDALVNWSAATNTTAVRGTIALRVG